MLKLIVKIAYKKKNNFDMVLIMEKIFNLSKTRLFYIISIKIIIKWHKFWFAVYSWFLL